MGVISCSGEELAEGTISRLATRRVLELLRPDQTVTLCLPLFLSGDEKERDFARTHPTITVDGCDKRCAQIGTEQHSGPVSAALVVSELLGGQCPHCVRSSRQRTDVDREAVRVVSEAIAATVDQVLGGTSDRAGCPDDDGGCACSRPLPGGKLAIADGEVTVAGLPAIFSQLAESGVLATPDAADEVLEAVGVYHPIPEYLRSEYRDALAEAYARHVAAS